MATAGKQSIQIEWFNVTYRSVLTVVLVIVLAAVGAVGYWYYFYMHQPKAAASDAIQRADRRMSETSALSEDPQFQETLDSAAVALREARQEFGSFNYDDARVAAIRSENLSLAALRLAGGQETNTVMVRFYRIEGDVRVKKSGAFSWEQANGKMVLNIGDQVKTSSSASAQLIYFDGTKTTIQPGSLLEIRDLYEDPVTQVRRVREKLNWGELEASTQARNVAGSYHEVATDKVSARAEEAGDFRVAYDKERKTAKFDVFEGKIQIDSGKRKESLVAGESIEASSRGALSDKQVLPGVPSLRSPRDQRVFIAESPLEEQITLRWDPVAGAEKYHLVIADRSLFTDPLYDAQRTSTSAVLDGVPTGSYFWKVSALADAGKEGPFSKPRRFRVSSQKIRDKSDNEPPVLEITEFVPIGQMVIVNGRTEPGASLWVDNENIDVSDDGTFYTVIRLRKEGVNVFRENRCVPLSL
jgi:hypothetical protein